LCSFLSEQLLNSTNGLNHDEIICPPKGVRVIQSETGGLSSEQGGVILVAPAYQSVGPTSKNSVHESR
jgi:hypothetical protein